MRRKPRRKGERFIEFVVSEVFVFICAEDRKNLAIRQGESGRRDLRVQGSGQSDRKRTRAALALLTSGYTDY